MKYPVDRTLEHSLAQQYLAKIGYVPDPEHQTQELGPGPRLVIGPATLEDLHAEIPNRFRKKKRRKEKMRYTPRQQGSATRKSSPSGPTPNREPPTRPISFESLHMSPPSQVEASCPILTHNKLLSPPPPPPPPLSTANLFSAELSRRQSICLKIEHQISACHQRIQSFPFGRAEIAKKHGERRFAVLKESSHDEEKFKRAEPTYRKNAWTMTAEEAEIEHEMREICAQYDRKSLIGRGVPKPESVDAFFALVADTEDRLKKAEEANQIEKRRVVDLEERLYKARCAVFEIEDEIERVRGGAMGEKAGGDDVKRCGIGGQKDSSKRRRKRGKKGKGIHGGKGGGRGWNGFNKA